MTTPAPQPHCEHECVCNWLACNVNCDTLNEPCKRKDCDNDTRSHPDPQPEATLFSDSSWVIIGYHLPFDEAIKVIEEEDPELAKEFTCVNHWWVKYEFADADEREEYGITSWWRIQEITERPKGITKKATVME